MSLTVFVGEKQLSGRMGKVLVMKGVVRVSSAVWIGGGGGGGGGAWSLIVTRGNDEVGSVKVVSITSVVEVERNMNENTFSTNLT